MLKVDGELSCWTRIQRRFMKSIKLHLETKVSQDCRVNELLPNFERRAEPFRGQNKKISCAQIIDKGLYYHISKVFFLIVMLWISTAHIHVVQGTRQTT